MGSDAADLLSAAVERHELFEQLRAAPMTRTEMRECLDVSRSTVHRVVRQFEGAGVVERDGDAYRLTPLGEVVAIEVTRSIDAVRSADRLSTFLAALEAADCDAGFETFRGATVTTPDQGDPYRPLRRLLAAAREADHIWEFDPTAPEPAYQAVLYERAGPDLSVSALYPPSVVDYLAADGEFDLDRTVDHDAFEVRVSEVPSFRLLVAGRHTYVGVYDEDALHLRVLADSGDDDTVLWARERFDRHWADATPYRKYRENGLPE